jgi:catalase (peroxidase I)
MFASQTPGFPACAAVSHFFAPLQVLKLLEPVKNKYPNLSYADLIVLAGTTALDQAAADAGSPAIDFKFCGGRSDAIDGKGTDVLEPRKYVNASVALADNARVMGLTPREAVALAGAKCVLACFDRMLQLINAAACYL